MSFIIGIDANREASKWQRIADRVLTFLGIRQQSIMNLSEPLRQFGEHLIRVHIPTQINVQGTPERFAPLSRRYAARKAIVAPGMPILIRSGAMATGYTYLVEGNQLLIENNTTYAGYHQSGTTKMPARKVVQLEDDDLGYGQLHRAVYDHVEHGTPVEVMVYE